MRIAVTGGAGFIGSKLCDALSVDGHEVTCVDLRPHERIRTSWCVDVTDKARVAEIFKIGRFEAVYHLAGPVAGTVRKDPAGSGLVQLAGTLNVMDACREAEVGRLLLASSFYVYDCFGLDDVVNENTVLNVERMDLFGASKFMSERVVREYHDRYKIEYVIFRFGSAYGAGNSSNVIGDFIKIGQRGEKIVVWGSGERLNQYTHIHDIVAGCVRALSAENGEIFNLISPEETSTAELAEALKVEFGFDVQFDRDKPEGPSMPYMSSRKAVRRLDWSPRSLVNGLKMTWDELRAA
jgi:UDP-glucose 4-epimerase